MTATAKSNLGELARAIVHEPEDSWEPTQIEIVAYYGPVDNPRKGKRRSVIIDADQFFGRSSYGAPMDGSHLIAIINGLRKAAK